ncbi:unnamed protein product [Ectocarpus sp. 13 AM-2016]
MVKQRFGLVVLPGAKKSDFNKLLTDTRCRRTPRCYCCPSAIFARHDEIVVVR